LTGQGFDYDRAKNTSPASDLKIPDGFRAEAMAAVGKPGAKETLPEKLRAKESPNDRGKLTESIREGPFRF